MTTLGQLAIGTVFRLFARNRDKTARPRYRFGRFALAQHDLVVIEHRGAVTLVRCMDAVVPMHGAMRIAR